MPLTEQRPVVIPIEPDPSALTTLMSDLCMVATGKIASCKANCQRFTLPASAGRLTAHVSQAAGRLNQLHLESICWSGNTVDTTSLQLPLGNDPERSLGLISLKDFLLRSIVVCNLLRAGKRIAANDKGYHFTSFQKSLRQRLPHGELRIFRTKRCGETCLVIDIRKDQDSGHSPEVLQIPISSVLQLIPDLQKDKTGAVSICADNSIAAFILGGFNNLPNPATADRSQNVRRAGKHQPRRVTTAAS